MPPLHARLVLIGAMLATTGCAVPSFPFSKFSPTTWINTAALTGQVGTVTGVVRAPAGFRFNENYFWEAYKVLKLDEKPLAKAEVYLVDARGKHVTGGMTAKVDSNGKFVLRNVPAGGIYKLKVAILAGVGEKNRLETWVHTSKGEVQADVTVASSMVVTAVSDPFEEIVPKDFDQAAFNQLVDAVGKDSSVVPDMGIFAGFAEAAIESVAAKDPSLSQGLAKLRQQLGWPGPSMGTVGEVPTPAPSPVKVPTDKPSSPSTPKPSPSPSP